MTILDIFCQPVIGPVPSGGEDLLEGVRRFLNRVVCPEKGGNSSWCYWYKYWYWLLILRKGGNISWW